MSGEFHWCSGGYLHDVLASVSDARPTTDEPVADAIGGLLTALAPLERAVAWHQACDSGLDEVILVASKERNNIANAAAQLFSALDDYDRLIKRLVEKNVKGSPS